MENKRNNLNNENNTEHEAILKLIAELKEYDGLLSNMQKNIDTIKNKGLMIASQIDLDQKTLNDYCNTCILQTALIRGLVIQNLEFAVEIEVEISKKLNRYKEVI